MKVAVLDYIECRVVVLNLPDVEEWDEEKVEEFLESRGFSTKDISYTFGDLNISIE